MHFHEKKIMREYALKKVGLSTILELHFEVIVKKQAWTNKILW